MGNLELDGFMVNASIHQRLYCGRGQYFLTYVFKKKKHKQETYSVKNF